MLVTDSMAGSKKGVRRAMKAWAAVTASHATGMGSTASYGMAA